MDEITLPTSAAEASSLVSGCLHSWESDGRDQLRAAFDAARATLAQGGSSLVSTNRSSSALTLLLHALVSSQTYRPRLSTQNFSDLFEGLSEENKDHDDLADALLDVFWSVDAEIDARKDLVLAQNSPADGVSNLAPDYDAESLDSLSLDSQVDTAKQRIADVVRELLRTSFFSRELVAERLEVPLLHAIGLVQDQTAFNRRGIRINTATLYKQQKFNLLREESEGYSGLITELISGMGPPIAAVATKNGTFEIQEREGPEARDRRARKVMNDISALIGYFDLDPSRVLDIILDIFSTNVVRHWPFFLSLLAASPWGKERARGSASTDKSSSSASPSRIGPVNLDLIDDLGNHTCAQILGFKFGFYQTDTNEKTPEELYLMTALMIREGYVRFSDLYAHISPDEKGMAALHEQYQTALSDKVMNARGNALSMAAPLTQEETDAAGGGTASAKEKAAAEAAAAAARPPPNQVVGLLKALLGIGQLKHGLFILARYPWLCGAFPEIADLYARLLRVILAPAYATVSLSTQISAFAQPPEGSTAGVRLRYDLKKQALVEVSPPQPVVTQIAPEPYASAHWHPVYFYPHWQSHLPACSIGDLLSDFIPLLRILGAQLYRDTTLLQQLCRLGKAAMRIALSSAAREEDKTAWLEVVRSFLLPALSMTSGNSGLVSEVWLIIRQLPYTERYSLYGEWKYSIYKRPELRVRQAETEKQAKGILKRISSDNLKLSGRALAKASHANPTIFFTVALNQVQAYDNLIAPIVESAKYLTHFEYDVFGFNLIDALSNPEKERTKQDGTSVSQWLKSLAAFTGTLYRRYAMMDCSPVLQYIANQLKENNSKDLVIIRELVLKMAGIEPLANLSDAQIAALTGGRLLRMEAMMVANAAVATTARANLRRSGARLLAALLESRMAMPLLILIAQQRQACIHLVPESEAHLKYFGNLFDTCQEVLFQYIEFLHNQLEPSAYASLMPTLKDLIGRFGVEPAIGFHIARPRLIHRMRAIDAAETEERLRKELLASKAKNKPTPPVAVKADEDVNIAEADPVKEESVDPEGASDEKTSTKKEEEKAASLEEGGEEAADEEKSAGKEAKEGETNGTEAQSADAEMANGENTTAAAAESSLPLQDAMAVDTSVQARPIWRAGLEEALEAAEDVLEEDVKELLGVHFYATFWQLSLADIVVPSDRYEQEMKAVQAVINANPEDARRGKQVNHKLRIQAQDLMAQLKAELKQQTLAHQATRKRINLEKDHWFPNTPRRLTIVQQMTQHCLLPRALLSSTDAIFSARFIKLMHACGTRNFSSLTVYDKILTEQVAPLIFSSTENEARNLARFFQVILTDLNSWFLDAKRYEKEAKGQDLPGFQLRWGDRHGGEKIPEQDLLSHEQFRTLLQRWHNHLRTALRECLRSGEYMRIRNAVVVMTRIAVQFPLWDAHGNEMLESVTAMTNEEQRGDLKVLGQGLLATLKKQQKSWIGKKPPPRPSAPSKPSNTDDSAKSVQAPSAAVAAAASDVKKDATAAAQSSTSSNGGEKRSGETVPARPQDSSLPARPAPSRTTSSSLPSRPSRQQSNVERESGKINGGSQRSTSEATNPSIHAARQAVLDSMNPPKSPASTPGAQATRDRASRPSAVSNANDSRVSSLRERERDRDTTSDRGGTSSAPRSAQPSPRHSREPESPRVHDAPEVEARRSSSRAVNRASSEDSSQGRRSERREREGRDNRDRERDRERDRGRDRREKEPSSSSSSDRTRGERDRERDRGRDRSDKSSSSGDRRNRERGDRDRVRDSDRDREKDRERERERSTNKEGVPASRHREREDVAANPSSQQPRRDDAGEPAAAVAPPSGPRSSRDRPQAGNARRPSDLFDDRSAARKTEDAVAPNSGLPRETTPRSSEPPRGPAVDRDRRSGPPTAATSGPRGVADRDRVASRDLAGPSPREAERERERGRERERERPPNERFFSESKGSVEQSPNNRPDQSPTSSSSNQLAAGKKRSLADRLSAASPEQPPSAPLSASMERRSSAPDGPRRSSPSQSRQSSGAGGSKRESPNASGDGSRGGGGRGGEGGADGEPDTKRIKTGRDKPVSRDQKGWWRPEDGRGDERRPSQPQQQQSPISAAPARGGDGARSASVSSPAAAAVQTPPAKTPSTTGAAGGNGGEGGLSIFGSGSRSKDKERDYHRGGGDRSSSNGHGRGGGGGGQANAHDREHEHEQGYGRNQGGRGGGGGRSSSGAGSGYFGDRGGGGGGDRDRRRRERRSGAGN